MLDVDAAHQDDGRFWNRACRDRVDILCAEQKPRRVEARCETYHLGPQPSFLWAGGSVTKLYVDMILSR